MKLSIIIVSYNSRAILKNCLNSIFTSKPPFDFEVFIIDNASKDGTVQEMRNLKFETRIIENKKNLGFSRANNQGVKISKGEYILFLNPDTIINRSTLSELVNFMDKNKNTAVVTCKVLLPNGKLDDSCHRGFPTPWNAFCYFAGLEKLFPKSKLFSGYHLGWINLTKVHEIDACAGSFMLVRRLAGNEIGWWDQDFFFYGEDLDFCYKLKEKGWKIFYVPSVSILHYKGTSSGIKKISKDITSANERTRKLATTERFKAMKIFYDKHYNNKYPGFIRWLVFKTIDLKLWISLSKI